MKSILEVGVYRPGGLTSEVTALGDVAVRVEGDTAVFTVHRAVKSRFKDPHFSSPCRLTRVYEKRQGRRRIVASKRTRLGDK